MKTEVCLQEKFKNPAGSLPASRAADDFAAMRGDEGLEGTQAFLEKRLPEWAQ